MSELTSNEKLLSFIAFVVVTASIGLALCIGFVLPYHWTSMEHVGKQNSYKDLQKTAQACQCDRRKITTDFINCIPGTIYDRIVEPQNDTRKPEDICELVHDYPYAVSLNVAAYDDDRKERRLACTGTILSKEWVLIGEDCVFNENEFTVMKLRAGSTYWSKGGKEYSLGAIAKFSDDGPMAVKLTKPIEFGKYVAPVKISRNGKYTTWLSAVSVGWTKGHDIKYEKLGVQKWRTTPCTDHCHKGEVMGNPTCSKQMFNRALVAENRLLVGIQTGICKNGNTSKIMYVDVQTAEYQSWFKFLLGEHKEPKLKPPLQSLERDLMGTTASPINIYEFKECAVLDSSNLNTVNNGDEYSHFTDGYPTTTNSKKPGKSKKTGRTTKPFEVTQTATKTQVVITTKPTIRSTKKTQRTKETVTASYSTTTTEGILQNRIITGSLRKQFRANSIFKKLSGSKESTTEYNIPSFSDETTAEETETTKPSTSTQPPSTTVYINPTMFPPHDYKRKGLNLASRIDETDEYGDYNDSDADLEHSLKAKFLIPLSTVPPNVVNYTYY